MNSQQDDTEMVRTDRVLKALWYNWAVSVSAISMPLLLSTFLPRIWLPFVCLIAGYFLIVFMRSDLFSGISACSLTIRLTARVLLLTSVAMFIVVILCTDWLVPTVIHLKLYNQEIPFITCLILFPIIAVCCILSLSLGLSTSGCRECQRRNGYYAGDSIVATLYHKESKYQIGILLMLALLLGAIQYWYYFTRYINTDISHPDAFFFDYMPVTVYLISLLFMAGRYRTMRDLYRAIEENHPAERGSTIVRFLIFRGNDLLLKQNSDRMWDTPAECLIPRCRAIGDAEARELLVEKTGISRAILRYCYTNDGFARGSNIIHYAAFIDADTELPADSLWFNAYMLDSSLASNALGPVLANELYRIHTMTMAWKTYDRSGRRLYRIKHYRPTFRLGDLKDWDIDYNDQLWFDIAANNEDRHFYRTRHLWRRLTDVFRRKQSTAE